MIKSTVKDYAAAHNTTVSNIYQKVKRNTLKSVVEAGITYIVEEDVIEPTEHKKEDKANCKKVIKQYKKMLKLKDEIISSKDSEISSLKTMLDSFTLVLNRSVKELENHSKDDIIDIQSKDKKKKKKSKKK